MYTGHVTKYGGAPIDLRLRPLVAVDVEFSVRRFFTFRFCFVDPCCQSQIFSLVFVVPPLQRRYLTACRCKILYRQVFRSGLRYRYGRWLVQLSW